MSELWGIGIENETYLQFENAIIMKGSDIFPKIGRERYSVDYRENYKEGILKKIIEDGFKKDDYYFIFEMFNSHCFDKVDRKYQHKTLYTKETPPNPNFNGKTIMEEWIEKIDQNTKNMFSDRTKSSGSVFFDGDAIEFITKYYENVTVHSVVKELEQTKKDFLEKLNYSNVLEKPVHFPEFNVGMNIFKTSSSIVLFNNGTYHFHVTLPTKVSNKRIIDYAQFKNDHIRSVYMLQWFEPFYIAILGSPDIFAVLCQNNNWETIFAGGSMRNAMSRYIGVGTYHKEMDDGKILTMKIEKFKTYLKIPEEKWWRKMIQENMSYVLPKEELGLDFNMCKQYQSGFEFRIFDYFPQEYLEDVLITVLLICQHSLLHEEMEWCTNDEVWNLITYKSLKMGYKAQLSDEEKRYMLEKLHIKKKYLKKFDHAYSYQDFFFQTMKIFWKKYQKCNVIQKMVGKKCKCPSFPNFNKRQVDFHEKQLTPLSTIFKF